MPIHHLTLSSTLPSWRKALTEEYDKPLVNEITVEELQAISGETLIIDVREEYEFLEVRAEGAKLLPLEQVPEAVDSLPAEKQFYIICASGNRSMVACEFLNAKGFDSVNIIGGTIAWNAAGYSVNHGPIRDNEVFS